MENYISLSDDEIIHRINENKEYELLQILIERHYPTILYHVSRFTYKEPVEDVIQEAKTAICSAVRDYDNSKASFKTFVSVCIERTIMSLSSAKLRKRDVPTDLLTSIEDTVIVDENSPEKIFFEKESYKTFKDNIKLELSALEYDVLQLFLLDKSYAEIASALNISEKSVDNSLARIRRKLKSN